MSQQVYKTTILANTPTQTISLPTHSQLLGARTTDGTTITLDYVCNPDPAAPVSSRTFLILTRNVNVALSALEEAKAGWVVPLTAAPIIVYRTS